MEWKKIGIEDREIFTKYTEKYYFEISDISFTNTILWKNSKIIEFADENDTLFIRTKEKNMNYRYFFPIGSDRTKEMIDILLNESNKTLEFRDLTVEQRLFIAENYPDNFEFFEDRDRYDYLYRVDELIELNGRKFHDKKNQINKFKNKFDYEYKRLGKDDRERIESFIEEWCEINGCDIIEGLGHERNGIKELLSNIDHLNIICGGILISGEIAAFSIADRLNSDTVLIHIEKALPRYQGAYQVINNEFLRNEFSDFTFVNREEDMGVEGLRKAKLSYNPVKLIEKHRAVYK